MKRMYEYFYEKPIFTLIINALRGLFYDIHSLETLPVSRE